MISDDYYQGHRVGTDTVDMQPTHKPNQLSPQFSKFSLSSSLLLAKCRKYWTKRILFLVLLFSVYGVSDI